MSIRKATIEDAPSLKELVSSLSHYYQDDKNLPLPTWLLDTLAFSAFERRITSDTYKNYVYVKDNEIVGYAALKGESHLYHLFVNENAQGHGIARQLWDTIKKNSLSSEFTVRSSMYAVPVYQKFGFIETEPKSNKDGIWFQPMRMG